MLPVSKTFNKIYMELKNQKVLFYSANDNCISCTTSLIQDATKKVEHLGFKGYGYTNTKIVYGILALRNADNKPARKGDPAFDKYKADLLKKGQGFDMSDAYVWTNNPVLDAEGKETGMFWIVPK
jgi:hypothetical protein